MPENQNIDNVNIKVKVTAPRKQTLQRINDTYDALKRLNDEVAKNGGTSKIANVKSMANATTSAASGTAALGTAIKGLKWGALLYGAKKGVQLIGDWVTQSNEYVENLNLFTVTMGKYAKEAYEYGRTVESVMGIDLSEWIRGQGVFNQIALGFGIAEDKAYTMSKGLTQLSYDLASFFNLDTEEAMNKVRSGIAGELEPLRNLGYALDQATLKQVALDHGITKSISSMTQAEKAQLRYITIMEQSKNAVGDMARTLMSPANAQRILTAQTDRLKRSLGQLFTPLAMEVVPVLTAITQLTTELVQNAAALVGFELPKIEDVESDKIADSWQSATESAEEYQRTILGFDQINKMNGATDTIGNAMGGDLGLDLSVYDYDFLGKANEKVEEIKKQVSDFFDMFRKDTTVQAWAGALESGFKTVVKVVKEVVGWVEPLYKNIIEPFADAVMPGLERGFDNMNNLFKQIGESTIWTTLKDTITRVSEALSPVSSFLGTIIGYLYEVASASLIESWNKLETSLYPILKIIEGLFQSDFKSAIKSFSEAFEGLVEVLLMPIKDIAKDLDKVFGTNLYEFFFGKEGNEEKKEGNQPNPMLQTAGTGRFTAAEEIASALGWDNKKPYEFGPALEEKKERPKNYKLNIREYATGGFPEDGLFFANHNEMVGKFTNGKTAVANNAQIVSGIASGVRDANSAQNELLREQNALLRQLIGVTSEKSAGVTTHDIVRGAQRMNRREGTTIIPVG